MTHKVLSIENGSIYTSSSESLPISSWHSDERLILFLLRHAEKDFGPDPDLTREGLQRANRLRDILQKVPFSSIFASPTQRTQQTASPLAEKQNLKVQVYNPLLQIPLVRKLRESDADRNVLMVGHMNTVPMLMNYLVGEDRYTHIPYNEYDHLFVVSLEPNKPAVVLELKY